MNYLVRRMNEFTQRYEYYNVHESKFKYLNEEEYKIVNETKRLKKTQHIFRLWQILMLYPKLKFFTVGFKNDTKPKKFKFDVYNRLKNQNNFL